MKILLYITLCLVSVKTIAGTLTLTPHIHDRIVVYIGTNQASFWLEKSTPTTVRVNEWTSRLPEPTDDDLIDDAQAFSIMLSNRLETARANRFDNMTKDEVTDLLIASIKVENARINAIVNRIIAINPASTNALNKVKMTNQELREAIIKHAGAE